MTSAEMTLREVTQANWSEALDLGVRPEQQRFVADRAPIVAIALAKAYLRVGGMISAPHAIYADATMVGFVALASKPETPDERWIFHFFIDQRYQGKGYGRAALLRLIASAQQSQPMCRALRLVVHPENHVAQRLYLSAGFQPTGALRWGEPEYQLTLTAEA